MKSCLVMGSGRSGTSLVGGILHQAGYFMGETLIPPRDSNPEGFFEWPRINRINEEILAPWGGGEAATSREASNRSRHDVHSPGFNQHWLLSLPEDVTVAECPSHLEPQIREVVERHPFAYKDPRFSYTLPVWRPFLAPDVVFICVFREPAATVASILKECRSQPYLASLEIDETAAFETWTNIYRHVLKHYSARQDRFLFVPYESVVDGTDVARLSRFLEVLLSGDFAEAGFNRSVAASTAPAEARRTYLQLCAIASCSPHDRARRSER